MDKSTLQNRQFADFLNQSCVALMAHQQNGHASKTVTVYNPKTKKNEQKTVCERYAGLSCEDHRKVAQQAQGAGHFSQVRFVPASFIISPDNKVLADNNALKGNQQKTLQDHLLKAIKDVGPGVSGAEYERILKALDKAKDDVEKQRFGAAITSLQTLLKKKLPQPLKDRIQKELDLVNQAGMDQIEKANGEGDPKKAKQLLEGVQRDFRGLPAAEEAKKKLAEAGKEKEGK